MSAILPLMTMQLIWSNQLNLFGGISVASQVVEIKEVDCVSFSACGSRQSLGDGFFFFFFYVKGRLLRTGYKVGIFSVFSGTQKNCRIKNHRSKKNSGLHAGLLFPTFGLKMDPFLFVKDRLVWFVDVRCCALRRPVSNRLWWSLRIPRAPPTPKRYAAGMAREAPKWKVGGGAQNQTYQAKQSQW